MSPEMEETEKIAEVLAATIREAAKLAADDANAFVAVVDKTGDALVARAEATARDLREHVEKTKERMRTEMRQLSEEIASRSEELAEESSRYIRHCAESRETILAHHRRLNGAGGEPRIDAGVEREIAEIMKTPPGGNDR